MLSTRRDRPSARRHLFRGAAFALITALAVGVVSQNAWAETAADDPDDTLAPSVEVDAETQLTVPSSKRDSVLGDDWDKSTDVAITTIGDSSAFYVLKATEKSGYAWAVLAALTIPGFETSQWVGNSCTTGDGSHVVAVFAPREAANEEQLFDEGAFAASVDVATGAVTHFGRGFTMAYFNPGCGGGDQVALTRFAKGSTFVGVVDAATGEPVFDVELKGQYTSAVPSGGGKLYAAGPEALQSIDQKGRVTRIAATRGAPYELMVGGDGAVTWIEQSGTDQATVKHAAITAGAAAKAVIVASGPQTGVGLDRDASGRVYVTGTSAAGAKKPPTGVLLVDGTASSSVSSRGSLVFERVLAGPSSAAGTQSAELAIEVTGTATESGDAVELHASIAPESGFDIPASATAAATAAVGPAMSPASVSVLGAAGAPASASALVGSANNPVENERACAVPRNDPLNQALQPKPRQVEWAADRAVAGELTQTRPANWNNWGMPAYTPQTMFPRGALSGGGRIPVQVLLGVLAQESNLWQASRYASPGQTGNPLIGNFYGIDISAGMNDNDFWDIDFYADADCGYGVGQITDGMRLAGMERSGDVPAMPYNQQRAIALDYQANIAKAVQMLQDKWNQTRNAGLVLNNGDPSKIENWFFAVWAYNTGYYPDAGNGSPWGVGWSNNPINPNYNPARSSFLDNSPSDASHPSDWPYPERVMGFAAWSLDLTEKYINFELVSVAGYRTAWWNGDATSGPQNRREVKPPRTLFCAVFVNDCSPIAPQPCTRGDFKCWWHGAATWKPNCSLTCGNEFVRFSPAASYMTEASAGPNGMSFPSRCSTSPLPSGVLVVDDIPLDTMGSTISVPPQRQEPGCTSVSSAGTFRLDFGDPSGTSYPSKIDFHQLGGGYNGHFYFTHTWNDPDGLASNITGKWTLGQALHQWTRVWVHTPDHGAWEAQAMYDIHLGDGTHKQRMVNQHTYANKWVSLGVFEIDGVPNISLSNTTVSGGSGYDDIAWDAVAFQPLSAKPADFIVSMGDSFSSGEGSPAAGGMPYYRETDHDGMSGWKRNGCHRSPNAWSRKATIGANLSQTVGWRDNNLDPTLDYHLIACSGSTSDQMKLNGTHSFHELSQLEQGYLDENTTLVTLSVGGNDIGFAEVIQACKLALSNCAGEEHDALIALGELPDKVGNILEQIQDEAPNATILLMGYPAIFADGVECVDFHAEDQEWLDELSFLLSGFLGSIAADHNSVAHPVIYADPAFEFTGHNVCGLTPAINNYMAWSPWSEGWRTAGDKPIFPLLPIGYSQQSIHPNNMGTDLYAEVMEDALAGHY